ncbi:hypothetical protein PAAG_11202 [Paracoccidioides lutzii Pb01]|uniref:Aminoglycoside phosphotransferase domain-containing protein n=1 Tax=Paracoccidioides lutzii (strain ATCC MYA-826 / Pb01) TaxID=502779 RepID=A0A0A2V2K1_PARBA|nr:hypothetical protein PAAG_11202 [Paracoccidioides lutzii Pb01]KGQ02026.1 hypothetical protein PAAG_11202 [Paracoccidioides lutzii Pb01]
MALSSRYLLNDLHVNNILIDDDWNVKCLIDLERACSWPIEMLHSPHWFESVDTIEPVIKSSSTFSNGRNVCCGTRTQLRGLSQRNIFPYWIPDVENPFLTKMLEDKAAYGRELQKNFDVEPAI